ncbi:hypothetical protein VTI74DRAFT_5915 [Chaetomium olivicolor]
MDTVMPEGFFANTQEIYAEVASYPKVPQEKIRQYWNVYTTTFRRLFDPSAFRLENFWWHVWGSERLRNLSGPELARLFEEFSNGPTFVPLRSPAQLYERSKAISTSRQDINGHIRGPARQAGHNSEQGFGSAESKKSLTPSSSRPPPPHPILKKSRGPSTSGPRPTARFVSPPASVDDAAHSGNPEPTRAAAASEMPPPTLPLSAKRKHPITAPATTSPAARITPSPTAAPGLSTPAPVVSQTESWPSTQAPPAKGTKSTTGRKVVIVKAGSRRKPVMARRTSSQSSASDTGPRVAGFVTASRRSGTKQAPTAAPQPPGQDTVSPPTSSPVLSEDAAGNCPAKSATSQPPDLRSVPTPDGRIEPTAVAQHLQVLGPQRRSTWDVRDSVSHGMAQGRPTAHQQPPGTLPQASVHAPPPPVAGFVMDQKFVHGAPVMVRSSSNNSTNPNRLREPGLALLPSHPTSSVATSTTTARGQFDSETVSEEPVVPEAINIPDQVRYGSYTSSSVLDTKFKPTPPNPAPPIPFGRSKSELALILKRGKTRKDEKQ